MGCEAGATRTLPDGRVQKCIGGHWVPMPSSSPVDPGGVSPQLIAKMEVITEVAQLTGEALKKAVLDPRKVVRVLVEDVE